MSRQSEQILLQVSETAAAADLVSLTSFYYMPQVPHVRHKKNDGTLYLMGSRLGWMQRSREGAFSVQHAYADVRTQKISPEGKAKVQLQIVAHDGNATTFQFVHPDGQQAQVSL